MSSRKSSGSIVSGTVWGILSKVLDAAAKFFTIPLLVGFYGKADYGLIALAFSLNAYLRLMDMGMNIGSIRFFSMWISKEEWDKVIKVSRSSIVFYGVIGLVNAIIFTILSGYGPRLFNVTTEQEPIFRYIMLILASSSIFNWASNVISQLLIAHSEISWVSKSTIVSSLFNFVTAFLAVSFKFSLPLYFSLYTLSTLIIIPLNIYKLNVYNIPRLKLISPKWDLPAFKEVIGYGVAILAMGVFQFTADNLRPLLLGKFASKGTEVLTDFRIIQTIVALVMTVGGVIRQVLLPSTSKMLAENDDEGISALVYAGTKYITVFISVIVFVLILNAKVLLRMYMGNDYVVLDKWLIIGLLTALLTLHTTVIDSLILSSGKTKFLVYVTAFGCIVSIPVTIYLAPVYNVGAAIIGYFIYNLIEVSAYYIFYIKNILLLDSWRILSKSFLPVFIVGVLAAIASYLIGAFLLLKNYYLILSVNTGVFLAVFSVLIFLFAFDEVDRKLIGRKILLVKGFLNKVK